MERRKYGSVYNHPEPYGSLGAFLLPSPLRLQLRGGIFIFHGLDLLNDNSPK
jgi:hypothetical protein